MTKKEIADALFNRIDEWEQGEISNEEIISAFKAAFKEIDALPEDED